MTNIYFQSKTAQGRISLQPAPQHVGLRSTNQNDVISQVFTVYPIFGIMILPNMATLKKQPNKTKPHKQSRFYIHSHISLKCLAEILHEYEPKYLNQLQLHQHPGTSFWSTSLCTSYHVFILASNTHTNIDRNSISSSLFPLSILIPKQHTPGDESLTPPDLLVGLSVRRLRLGVHQEMFQTMHMFIFLRNI